MNRKTAVFAASAAVTLTACAADLHTAEPVSASVFAMDTYMTVTAYGENAENAVNESTKRISELDALWDANGENGDISRVNSAGTAEVSTETAELLRFALSICKDTDGALDITLLPLLREWGFTTGEYNVPDGETISRLLADTGADRVSISGNTVTADGVMLDLGAVAKGRTGDIIAGIMRENGVKSALCDLGGNIHCVGRKPDGGNWKIGLKDPCGRGIFGVIEAEDCAVVTSGGYERFFERDGETYWHILDPRTGRPAKNGLISATVVGSEGALCDALSTALFVMGEEKAEKYWRERHDFEFVLVTDDDRVLVSEGLENSFKSEGLFGETEVIRLDGQ